MNERVQLTAAAHDHLRPSLHRGAKVIDATAGNGHDTLFLADAVAPTGKVIAFDLQREALDVTAKHLGAANNGAMLSSITTLVQAGHERLIDFVPTSWVGETAAVCFNLGYLPGGDKSITTQSATTITALTQATDLLKVKGRITVIVYPGHTGGGEEARAVQTFVRQSVDRFEWCELESPGPILYGGIKIA